VELKVGDLVRHLYNKRYGIVMQSPTKYKGCVVCQIQWCFIDKSNLIDVDFLDKVSKS
jgi:hypothetical protein